MRRWFVALAISAAGCGSPAPPSAAHPALEQQVSLSLPTDDGKLASVPSTRAKVTVADFFSPACKPCREKVPALWARRADIEALGGELVLVGVLGDQESTADARKALAEWGVQNARFLVDSGDASRREAGVRDLPTTMVLDARGKVRWVAGPSSTAEEIVSAARSVAR